MLLLLRLTADGSARRSRARWVGVPGPGPRSGCPVVRGCRPAGTAASRATVQLTGVLSNPEAVKRLERAGAAKAKCLPEVQGRVPSEPRRRHGWTRPAILKIVIGSTMPMTPTDVSCAAEGPISGDACSLRDGEERPVRARKPADRTLASSATGGACVEPFREPGRSRERTRGDPGAATTGPEQAHVDGSYHAEAALSPFAGVGACSIRCTAFH